MNVTRFPLPKKPANRSSRFRAYRAKQPVTRAAIQSRRIVPIFGAEGGRDRARVVGQFEFDLFLAGLRLSGFSFREANKTQSSRTSRRHKS